MSFLSQCNTDTDVALMLFSFFLSYLYALLIILKYHLFWERKLMMTRHELGGLVLGIVPPIISM